MYFPIEPLNFGVVSEDHAAHGLKVGPFEGREQ